MITRVNKQISLKSFHYVLIKLVPPSCSALLKESLTNTERWHNFNSIELGKGTKATVIAEIRNHITTSEMDQLIEETKCRGINFAKADFQLNDMFHACVVEEFGYLLLHSSITTRKWWKYD